MKGGKQKHAAEGKIGGEMMPVAAEVQIRMWHVREGKKENKNTKNLGAGREPILIKCT